MALGTQTENYSGPILGASLLPCQSIPRTIPIVYIDSLELKPQRPSQIAVGHTCPRSASVKHSVQLLVLPQ